LELNPRIADLDERRQENLALADMVGKGAARPKKRGPAKKRKDKCTVTVTVTSDKERLDRCGG
jgi:hypothetical protein